VLLDYPLLSPGDQMGRDEFLGRWYQMPGLKFAELIEGAVYMPSPLSLRHANRDNLIQGLLFSYAAHVPDCQPLTNATWLMTPNSVPQPDASLRWVREVGGRSKVDDELMAGVPELAVEICLSSRSYDLGPKRLLYQSAGVPEYLAIILENQQIEWRVLEQGGRYRLLKPHKDGTLRSRIFPGLWLDIDAYWRNDRAALLATLERGIAAESKS
jgi:Uma2 family endonuclease